MNTTTIIEPFDIKNSASDAKKQQKYKAYYDILREHLTDIAKRFKDDKSHSLETVTLDDVLDYMSNYLEKEITLDDYYMMLRSTCKCSTVFLKRTCRELMLNQYNPEILLRHRGNMDIQHITDPYGVAVYVSAYLTESSKHMSATLRKAEQEMYQGNLSVRNRLIGMANVFHNCSEMGAQEAVYHLLSMPVCRSTRQTVFINTYRTKDRTRILKDTRWLELMSPESTDIFRTGLLEQYKLRPTEKVDSRFKDMCLAEYASRWEYVSKDEAKNMGKPVDEMSLPKPFREDVYDDFDEDLYLDENDEGN